jgi:glutamyl-Q tRNA(Asp) synthetase
MPYSSAISADFQYLHVPLVLAEDGQKLSKQNGAVALDVSNPMHELNLAAASLGLHPQQGLIGEALGTWTNQWRTMWAL